tara:strand:- start:309 stop:437 length:129 start_codon:yes stop_codon:yes gene_type:complete
MLNMDADFSLEIEIIVQNKCQMKKIGNANANGSMNGIGFGEK